MAYPNIGWHARSTVDDRKLVGGSFGGEFSMDTANRLVNRLVNNLFDVVIKPSGTARFVDKSGREVRLYMSIDACNTEKGKAVLKEWREARRIEAEREAELEERRQSELEEAMRGLSHEEVLRRLALQPPDPAPGPLPPIGTGVTLRSGIRGIFAGMNPKIHGDYWIEIPGTGKWSYDPSDVTFDKETK